MTESPALTDSHGTHRASGLIGMPAFTSINSHLGLELGWWDDLESLIYVLIYLSLALFRGSNPTNVTRGVPNRNHQQYLSTNEQYLSSSCAVFLNIRLCA